MVKVKKRKEECIKCCHLKLFLIFFVYKPTNFYFIL